MQRYIFDWKFYDKLSVYLDNALIYVIFHRVVLYVVSLPGVGMLGLCIWYKSKYSICASFLAFDLFFSGLCKVKTIPEMYVNVSQWYTWQNLHKSASKWDCVFVFKVSNIQKKYILLLSQHSQVFFHSFNFYMFPKCFCNIFSDQINFGDTENVLKLSCNLWAALLSSVTCHWLLLCSTSVR